MIKQHKKTSFTEGDYYTVQGVISDSRPSKDKKSILEPVRKFLYTRNGVNRVGLNISIKTHDTVCKRKVPIFVDVVCFDEDSFPGILELNLDSGDSVEIFGRCAVKADRKGISLVVDDPNWIKVPKAI